MKTIFALVALTAVTVAAPLVAPAQAADATTMICSFTDNKGSKVSYAFAPNTENSVVEAGFKKNGKFISSDVGQRPVWRLTSNKAGGLLLIPQGQPQWKIGTAGKIQKVSLNDGSETTGADARLFFNGKIAGVGGCVRTADEAPAPEKIEDLGIN